MKNKQQRARVQSTRCTADIGEEVSCPNDAYMLMTIDGMRVALCKRHVGFIVADIALGYLKEAQISAIAYQGSEAQG